MSRGAMRLTDLPDDVLRRVMQLADQPAREACMLACVSLSKAARAKGVWSAVTFRDVGQPSALEFMETHAVSDVTIFTACPDDVACFFQRLAGMGVDCVVDLRIHVVGDEVQRIPRDFLTGVCRQTTLRHLAITVENLEHNSEVCLPTGLVHTSLETIDIREKSRVERPKQLVMWWQGSRLPNLRRAVVRLALSDVMANLYNLPSLRELTYRYDDEEGDETYEDVRAFGACLDVLDINVGCETDYETLCSELAMASIKKLVIVVNDETVDLRYPPCKDIEELVLRMDITHCIVHLDFNHLVAAPKLRCIRVEQSRWVLDAAPVTEHVVEFHHTPSLNDWIEFCGRVTVVCPHPSNKLTISRV